MRIKRVRTCTMSSTVSMNKCLPNVFLKFSSIISSLLLQIMVAGKGTGKGKKYVNLLGDKIVTVAGSNHTNFSAPATPPPHYKKSSLAIAVSSKNQTGGGSAKHLSARFSSFPIIISS